MPQRRPGTREPAQGHAGGRLPGHTDLDIRRPIAGEHRLKPLKEMVAQLLGHPFAADHGMHGVALPADAVAVPLVQQVLDKRRVAQDQVAVTGTEKTHRR